MGVERGTIAELAAALRSGRVTAAAITEECLARIDERNGELNAFITVLREEARARAAEADWEIASGRYRGPLHGVPISLKDLFDLRGTPTTAASRVRKSHVARADAPVVERLRDAGAIIIGKTNLHEFAFGTTNEDSAFGPARHPADPSRSPGGSSGGSAISVSTGMAYASLGTDTGGSIRIPAAACGVVGLKPAFGELSTSGVVPLSTSLDHVGPLTRSVGDAAIVYEVLHGRSPNEASGSPRTGTSKLGLLRDYFTAVLDADVAASFDAACQRLRDAGIELVEVAIPHARDIAPIYVHIQLAEAAEYHAKTLESRAEDYSAAIRTRLEMGRYILAEDYLRALRGRALLQAEVNAALQGCDALLLPAMPIPAPKLGTESVRLAGVEQPVRNVMLRLTQLFNLTGHPALALPCGINVDGLPIGAQLVGHAHGTSALLDTARTVETYLGPGASR